MSGTLKFRDEYGQWQEFRAARGRVGPPGPPWPPGTGVEIQGVVQTEADLPASGDTGHAWLVVEPDEDYYGTGTDRPVLLVWDHVDTAWVPAGPLQGEPGPPGEDGPPGPPGDPATATPLAPAGGTNGTSPNAARQDHTHDGVYANASHTHTPTDMVGVLDTSQIPGLDASKVISGTFSVSRIPNLDASKITSGEIPMPRIAPLAAAKVTSGTFDSDRIPNLNANKITAGTLSVNRLPVGTTSGTVAAGDHTHLISAIFPYTHRVGTTDLSLRVGPDYTHAVIGTLTQSDAVAITTATPQAGGGDTWRYVWSAKLGLGWLPWLGMTSI